VSLSGRTVYRGRLPTLGGAGDGEIEFTALGDRPAQLVGALSGGGALRFRGLAMPALGQATFMDLATQSARSGAPTRTALSDSIRSRAVGRLAVPDGETRVTLAGGVMRFGPVTIHDGMNSVIAAASYDLKTFGMSARQDYVAKSLPKGWNGPPPQVTLTWRGEAGGRPTLDVDADELANGLMALAIQRDSERIDAIEQDQRERAFFNRRLRAAEDERRADEERARAELLARVRAERERADRERQERERQERERMERLRAEESLRAPPTLTPPVLPPPLRITPLMVQ
ncbi:MAG: hypothetical protein ACRCTI_15430, partial [Beijerinckiaceae bacterium]